MHAVESEPILMVEGLTKGFKGNKVLRGVTGAVRRGAVTALVGSNGAGKSTFFNIVTGLLSPDRGTICLSGRDITRRAGYLRARAGIARTFQHPRTFGSLTVREAVALARTAPREEGIFRNLGRVLGVGGAVVCDANVDLSLVTCRLEHLSDVPASQLSYGERKLLMLAQAIAFDRELYCFDELCAGLEPAVVDYLMGVMSDLVRRGKTVVFVEHNLGLVRELADDVIFLHEGAIHRSGDARSVLGDPDVISLYLGE